MKDNTTVPIICRYINSLLSVTVRHWDFSSVAVGRIDSDFDPVGLLFSSYLADGIQKGSLMRGYLGQL